MRIIIELNNDNQVVKSNGSRRLTDFVFKKDRQKLIVKANDETKEDALTVMSLKILDAVNDFLKS